ncbi:DUF4974 domain-containing protein [Marinilabiliaceae bacterium ANBcel2]|nr:DUF4974 domain-containing protein [Marinilabiliaceae bacterium ANBcel2]
MDNLKRFIKGECREDEFYEVLELLKGLKKSDELEEFMRSHWNDLDSKLDNHQKIGDTERFNLILDRIHHHINVDNNRGRVVSRIFAGYSKIAALLLIPLISAFIIMFFKYNYSKDYDAPITTMNAPAGVYSEVCLPDGSSVFLNSQSELSFPVTFENSDVRKVNLNGEGYFEVIDDDKPFIVNTNGVTVNVTGTSFNVSAYCNDEEVYVALVDGSLSVSVNHPNHGDIPIDILPGDVAVLSKESSKIMVESDANMDIYTSWIKGRMTFINEPLESVLRKMERKYGVVYKIKDSSLKDYHITATILNETLEQFLELLSVSSSLEYKILRVTDEEGNVFDKRIVELYKK